MSYRIEDYTPAQQAAIRRIIAEGGVDDFAGMNCDECAGWDGESHRCRCGNRRMTWNTYPGSDAVYAEAY